MTSEPIEKFWMVWGVQRNHPTYRHRSKLAAQAEARRLARVRPGELFVVLAAVDAFIAVVPEPDTVRLTKPNITQRTPDDDIPF
jgi:hypothetical protein